MNDEWKCSDLKCIQKPSWLSLTYLPVQPLSREKSLDGPRVRVISPVVKEKVYGGKDLLKSQVLSSEWNTERVREDASSDSEDGEDDELPCVIGESAGDCVWRVGKVTMPPYMENKTAAMRKPIYKNTVLMK